MKVLRVYWQSLFLRHRDTVCLCHNVRHTLEGRAMTESPSTPHAAASPKASDNNKKSTGASTQERLQNTAKDAAAFWYDRQHRDLLFYLSIAIFFLELVVGAVAFFYGVIHAEPGVNGGPPRFMFPWLAYMLAAVLVPAALLLIVHLAGVGLFRSLRGQDADEAWRQELPERLRKVYAIIQGAPTVVLLLGLLLLGVALFYFDGAMNALFRLGRTAEQYLPWIIGGVVGAWCVGYVARIWLNYRTRRLEAEFAFRREVLERTGIIIVEQGSLQLPTANEAPKALEVGPNGTLPPGSPTTPDTGPVLDVTPPKPE